MANRAEKESAFLDPGPPSRGLYLQWEGKRVYRQLVPTPRLLEPVETFSYGDDRPNMLIEGDNLQVLASLKSRYAGQIDVIYIDPPYNLGKDDFRYSDKRFHDPDADAATPFTSPTRTAAGIRNGSISSRRDCTCYGNSCTTTAESSSSASTISSYSASACCSMRYLARTTTIGTIIWKATTDNNPTRIAIEHEYILCYAKSKERLPPRWTNPDIEVKPMMLDAFDRIKAETNSLSEIARSNSSNFAADNSNALGDLYRYRR